MRKSGALVSVLVPAWNVAPYIERTINSALQQTHQALEVLVVDDGSSDETAKFVSRIVERESRVRLITQPHKGVAEARNRALEHARGEFIATLDADDLWHPRKIEFQLDRMINAGHKVALAYCWRVVIDNQDTYVIPTQQRDLRPQYEGEVLRPLVERNFVSCASVPLIRRGVIDEVGGYNPVLRAMDAEGCEDWELYLAIAERWNFCLVPKVLVGYRRRPGSLSTNVRNMRRSREIVMCTFAASHPGLSSNLRTSKRNMRLWSAKHNARAGRLWSGAVDLIEAFALEPVESVEETTRAVQSCIGSVLRYAGLLAPVRRRSFHEITV